jgi:hypothetical protein
MKTELSQIRNETNISAAVRNRVTDIYQSVRSKGSNLNESVGVIE